MAIDSLCLLISILRDDNFKIGKSSYLLLTLERC
jgi:hypothetical protein